MKYSDWFLDPRWQRKRLDILQRDNWTCQVCGFHPDPNAEHRQDPLDVHHIRYVDGRRPWEYEDRDLITLCRPCHGKQDRRGGLTPIADVIPDALEDMAAPSLRARRHSRQWEIILRRYGVRDDRYDERLCVVCWTAWRVDLTRCVDCREGAA